MNFFSGFCLQNESEIFKSYLNDGKYTVAGFSYGAIKAYRYIIKSQKRVDKLQLFSPAFFQNKDEKFKRLQLLSYKKDYIKYEEIFLKNITNPSLHDMYSYHVGGKKIELKELLYWQWNLSEIVKRGVDIEVYLGEKDKIIDSKVAMEFFKDFATVYFIKGAGHTLWR